MITKSANVSMFLWKRRAAEVLRRGAFVRFTIENMKGVPLIGRESDRSCCAERRNRPAFAPQYGKAGDEHKKAVGAEQTARLARLKKSGPFHSVPLWRRDLMFIRARPQVFAVKTDNFHLAPSSLDYAAILTRPAGASAHGAAGGCALFACFRSCETHELLDFSQSDSSPTCAQGARFRAVWRLLDCGAHARAQRCTDLCIVFIIFVICICICGVCGSDCSSCPDRRFRWRC